MIKAKSTINLDLIGDEELLTKRISDLPLQIKGTWLEECIAQLYKELEDKGILFRPECYLADEWLTPYKENCIGIPFYLAHPALIRLEKKFMLEAEGETKPGCMKLLRHECGHALTYAFRFHKRKKWQSIFGRSTKEYKDTFKYRPYSKNYVRHLDGYYAQYHPEEDFVETFAVWLTPNLDWEERYKGWRALKKLRYVDCLVDEAKVKEARFKSSQKFYRLSTLRYSLKSYYKRKRHEWAEEFPDFHDRFLNRVFHSPQDDGKKLASAAMFIQYYRRSVINSVAKISGEKKYVINDLLKDVIKRSKELKCLAPQDETQIVIHLTAYISSLIMNYQYTGRFRGDKKKK